MPKKFPEEFKRDVANVARRGDLTLAEVAHDFDVSVESVRRWMRQADIDDGIKDGLTTSEQSELVQLRRDKRRPPMVPTAPLESEGVGVGDVVSVGVAVRVSGDTNRRPGVPRVQ